MATKTISESIADLTFFNLVLKLKSLLPRINDNTLSTQGDTIAAVGTTTNLSAAVVTASTIAASNLTAAIPTAPTKAEVDAGINTLKTAVVAILDIKADNADLETLRTQTEARLDGAESKIDTIIAALKTTGVIAE